MKRLALVFVLLTFCLSANADSASIDAAASAATDWLALVDEREYTKSYSAASFVMRAEVSQDDWLSHVRSLRKHLGQLNERTLNSSEFHQSLPDAPPGKYVLFTFDSLFENNKYFAEIVAVVKDSDGVWRVVGYYFA